MVEWMDSWTLGATLPPFSAAGLEPSSSRNERAALSARLEMRINLNHAFHSEILKVTYWG